MNGEKMSKGILGMYMRNTVMSIFDVVKTKLVNNRKNTIYIYVANNSITCFPCKTHACFQDYLSVTSTYLVYSLTHSPSSACSVCCCRP